MTKDIEAAALDCVALGLSVIPIRRDNKRPYLGEWKPFQTKAAEQPQIQKWWRDFPDANIGVVTGSLSGVFVLDVDGFDGPETLAQWQRDNGPLPATWRTKTGRGEHIWFRFPINVEIRNSQGDLARGLDVRGEGGYVIAPGSVHASGARYEWQDDCAPNLIDIALAPDWLIEKVKKQPKPAPAKSNATLANADQETTKRLRRIFEEERSAVSGTSTGSRNGQLNRSTFALAQLYHYGAYTESEVRSAMEAACLSNGIIGDDGQGAFDASFRSGWTAGLSEPRQLPEWQPSHRRDRSNYMPRGTRPEVEPAAPDSYEQVDEHAVPDLGEWDAGLDDYDIEPREWLLGTVFCKGFVSGLVAPGAAGKTALRVVQYLALATGKPLSGEFVFRRCRVLLLSLEDDRDELRRRIKAAIIRHKLKAEDIAGWLYLATPRDLLLAEMRDGKVEVGCLETALRHTIKVRGIDLVGIDPLVKAHAVEENDNGAMDFVAGRLALIAMQTRCAFDTSHHTSKGPQTPGDANKARGASAYVNALRLVYSLTVMSPEEAQTFGVPEQERRSLIRVDSAKVNIAPPSGSAQWFRLIGVSLDNATDEYPQGDTVQTVEPWTPPDTWAGLSIDALNAALTEIDTGLPNGQRFSHANKAGNRAAWPVVQKHCPDKAEGQCRDIVRTWIKNGVIFEESYEDPVVRKPRAGLRVNASKRPT